jgi:hypothetical protein
VEEPGGPREGCAAHFRKDLNFGVASFNHPRMTGRAPRTLPKWQRHDGNSADAGSGVTGLPAAFKYLQNEGQSHWFI